MTTLVWFKRDLRARDHAALEAAAKAGPVIALYIVEPEYWSLPDTSARQWEFTAECLESLRGALSVPLLVRVGDAIEVFESLLRVTPITALISQEETGNASTVSRDLRVRAWCAARGIGWRELPQSGVVRRLKGRDGWAARRERFIRQPQIAPVFPTGPSLEPGAIPSARALKLRADPCPGRQRGGREEALSLLGGFLSERGQNYRKAMSSPVEGEWACSRLSPYLALGVLSGREAAQAADARKKEVPAGARDGWKGSLNSFTSRLAWRDHFMQKLEDEPAIESRCLHR
ncbi:MAG: deoxyribodipyrimidine photo-lyase, partial [Pseudomonadota bacterium]